MIEFVLLFVLLMTDSSWTIIPAIAYGRLLGLSLLQIYAIYMIACVSFPMAVYLGLSVAIKRIGIQPFRAVEEVKRRLGTCVTFAAIIAAAFFTWNWLVAAAAAFFHIDRRLLLPAFAVQGAIYFLTIVAIMQGVATFFQDIIIQVLLTAAISMVVWAIVAHYIQKRI